MEAFQQGLHFPVSKLPRFLFTIEKIGAFVYIKGFDSPFCKLHFMSSYLATYTVKAAAPMQKSCKGNIVEAQLINRSR
jgi:hypothetical protein